MRPDKKALCSVDNLNMINTPGDMIALQNKNERKEASVIASSDDDSLSADAQWLSPLFSSASRLSQKPLKCSSQRHRRPLPAPLTLALWPLSFLRGSAREGGSPFQFVPATCASYNPALLQSACRQHSCAACKRCSKAW